MKTSHSLCQQVPPAEGGGTPGALDAVLPASLLVLVMRVACGATFVWRIVKGILLVAQRLIQLQASFELRLAFLYTFINYPSLISRFV